MFYFCLLILKWQYYQNQSSRHLRCSEHSLQKMADSACRLAESQRIFNLEVKTCILGRGYTQPSLYDDERRRCCWCTFINIGVHLFIYLHLDSRHVRCFKIIGMRMRTPVWWLCLTQCCPFYCAPDNTSRHPAWHMMARIQSCLRMPRVYDNIHDNKLLFKIK